MERIERLGGPLVLRYKSKSGKVTYWRWETVLNVQIDHDGGTLTFIDKSVFLLSHQEAQQVREQLDALIDPPTFRVNVKKQERESDLWAGHPFIAKPEEE